MGVVPVRCKGEEEVWWCVQVRDDGILRRQACLEWEGLECMRLLPRGAYLPDASRALAVW